MDRADDKRQLEPEAMNSLAARANEVAEKLLKACNGHPAAEIPWPHRLLHEAEEIIRELLVVKGGGGKMTAELPDWTCARCGDVHPADHAGINALDGKQYCATCPEVPLADCVLPDSLNRPWHVRVRLLRYRADAEAGLAVLLAKKLATYDGGSYRSSLRWDQEASEWKGGGSHGE